MKIKRNVKQFRDGYGFTQTDMAIILDVDVKTIQRAEKDGEIDSKYAHKMSLIENNLEHGFEAVSKLKKYDREKVRFLLNGNYFEDLKDKMFLWEHIENSRTHYAGGEDFNYRKVLEIICAFGGKDNKYGFGATRLSKLLYKLDKESLKANGIGATGLTYIKWQNGPVPYNIYSILDDMVAMNLLDANVSEDGEFTTYLVKDGAPKNNEYNDFIKNIITKKTADLIEESHNDKGWIEAQTNQKIEIEY